MTTVYLLRHSQPFKNLLEDYNVKEVEQIRNEKNPLSINGEILAKKMADCPELSNIDILYSSHYVRAICTAKYIAENNNIKINVDERLGERKFGVDDISNLPDNFFNNQFHDFDYKLNDGESLNEVFRRMNDVFFEILNLNKDKNIAIVSHATSLSIMLKNWCDIKLTKENKVEIYFKNKLIFDGSWNAPELFKLEFDSKFNLTSIENIR